ncbi:MAG TPA: sigma-70 family RNA polymerase sigma factor, partial [Verrucomicrobiae bacterium]|nr:sigma-70 family RNA polymerase sigma factor [Verrucomicrobiae bacterium]
MDDWELIQQFRKGSDGAFGELVKRYVNMVYSSALRQVGQPQLAEEVSQAVFLLLARKATSFRSSVILAGWLFRTTRFIASRTLRSETRRKTREQEAFQMQQDLSSPDNSWRTLAPVIDEALDDLNEADRNAVLLRFMDDKTFRDTGAALGVSEDAAKKRVTRALDKLREFFRRRGFAISTVALAGALAQNLTSAAPAGLPEQISLAAAKLSPTAVGTWPWTLFKITAGLAVLGIALTWMMFLSKPNRAETSKSLSAVSQTVNTAASRRSVAAQRANQGAGLKLRVVDAETGLGIPAARVLTDYWHEQPMQMGPMLFTDADGFCQVPLPPGLVRLDIAALVDWYVYRCVMFREQTVWPVPAEFTLKLEPAVSIGGWVRDERGGPVAGADIFLHLGSLGDNSSIETRFEGLGFMEDVALATTDRNGQWACAVVPRGYKQFSIGVRHKENLGESFQTDAQSPSGIAMADLWAGKAVLTLKGRKPLSIFGRVIDQQGRPISGAKVKAGLWQDRLTTITDSNGSFTLTRLTAGTNGVTAAARGFAPERVMVNLVSNTGQLEIQLKPGNLLRVRVVDETKAPVDGATVALSDWKDRHAYDWSATTDASGSVEWSDAPPDRIELDVLKTGFFESRDNAARANGEEQTITMRKSLTVSGTVTDQETGQRIPKFKVVPGYQQPESRQWFRDEFKIFEHGYYNYGFETFRPPFTVRVEADGYEVAMSDALSDTPRDQTWDFALKRIDPRLAIRGTVLLPDGGPAKNAEVSLGTLDFDIRLGYKRLRREYNTRVTNVNERGEFAFPADPNAHTLVALSAEGFARVRIVPGQPTRMELQPWGRVEGIVRVPNPQGHRRSVRLDHPGTWEYDGCIWLLENRADVNEAGEFTIDGAPPGELTC